MNKKQLRKAKHDNWAASYVSQGQLYNKTDPYDFGSTMHKCPRCKGELRYVFTKNSSTNRRWVKKSNKTPYIDLTYNDVYKCIKCKKLSKPYSKMVW